MKWLAALSSAKALTVLCLFGLGVNGLIQVALQRDMAGKAGQLHAQVARAQRLSGQMTDSLHGLTALQSSTAHMQGTLHELAAATSDMDHGLAILSSTVTGIAGSIQTLGQSTQASKAAVDAAKVTSGELLTVLRQIVDVNGHVMASLGQMAADQAAINRNLQAMNQKTQAIP